MSVCIPALEIPIIAFILFYSIHCHQVYCNVFFSLPLRFHLCLLLHFYVLQFLLFILIFYPAI